ncbi:MAG: HAD family hydrolase [Lachnospiraceae bacterium]|nr:HAD family hydrolase [Lachnospiraceae bacterium]
MKLFCMDLDNTIIYSYRHDIGEHKRNVEIYQGREVSFVTDRTYELLLKMREQFLLVPVSTRTIEQYSRIDLGIGSFPYALVCNGGVLLRDGERDQNWYEESKKAIEESLPALARAADFLKRDPRRIFELRFIEDLFLFTKCEEPGQVTKELEMLLAGEPVTVYHNGIKVYAVPRNLSKGRAVERLCEALKPEKLLAAGDSGFDSSMVEIADPGLVPAGFSDRYHPVGNVREMPGNRVFSEEALETALALSAKESRPRIV